MTKVASVALLKTPQGAMIEFVEDLANVLGVKAKTAEQILKNVPLRVYNKLDIGSARILVEALNVTTRLDWVLVSPDDDIPAVNWNKHPTIHGMSLEDLVKKNHPKKTGVVKFFPSLAPEISAGMDSINKVSEEAPDQTILKSADSVIRHLNHDLEAAYKNKIIDKPRDVLDEDSLPAFDTDSQNELGLDQKGSKLESGFYNLFLPLLKGKGQRQLAEKLCHEILRWDAKEIRENLAKPIVCIAREIDDIDAARLIESFEKKGMDVNAKLRKRL